MSSVGESMKRLRRIFLCAGAALLGALPAVAQQSNASGPPGLPGLGNAGYPPGSTPAAAVFGPGANAAGASASIAPPAGQFAYLCYFEVSGNGATAATTVSPQSQGNTVGPNGLFWENSYTYPLGAGVAATPFTRSFNPCLRGATQGSALGVNVPGAAGNTTTVIQVTGYTQ